MKEIRRGRSVFLLAESITKLKLETVKGDPNTRQGW